MANPNEPIHSLDYATPPAKKPLEPIPSSTLRKIKQLTLLSALSLAWWAFVVLLASNAVKPGHVYVSVKDFTLWSALGAGFVGWISLIFVSGILFYHRRFLRGFLLLFLLLVPFALIGLVCSKNLLCNARVRGQYTATDGTLYHSLISNYRFNNGIGTHRREWGIAQSFHMLDVELDMLPVNTNILINKPTTPPNNQFVEDKEGRIYWSSRFTLMYNPKNEKRGQ